MGFVSPKNNNEWRFFITDHLGSVTALTDSDGNVTDAYDYDEYGNLLSKSGNSYNPFRFIGQELDEDTGLIYLRARFYDPRLGRFVSRDPEELQILGNLYVYANGNPSMNIDITGKNDKKFTSTVTLHTTRTGSKVAMEFDQYFYTIRHGNNYDLVDLEALGITTCNVPEGKTVTVIVEVYEYNKKCKKTVSKDHVVQGKNQKTVVFERKKLIAVSRGNPFSMKITIKSSSPSIYDQTDWFSVTF